MKIIKSIVTGGAGFIGSNLVDRLVKEGHKVIVLDNFVSGKKKKIYHIIRKIMLKLLGWIFQIIKKLINTLKV